MALDKVSVLAPEENRAGPTLTALALALWLCAVYCFSLWASVYWPP